MKSESIDQQHGTSAREWTAKSALSAIRESLQCLSAMTLAERVEVYNSASEALFEFIDLPHPALNVQLVPVDQVEGNTYNPNKVAPPEMRLLRLSILKDGMTMPVVACGGEKKVVVDGFHRRTLASDDKDIRESLGGYLPVAPLDKDIEDRMTSTVRHNMARGTHQVELSAKLVTALTKHHWTNERIGIELGMEPDEVLRMKQITGLAEAFADREFSKSWQ